MSLTNDDLKKIENLVNARAERTEAYVDRRVSIAEATMMTKEDGREMKVELIEKIDEVKTMFHEDHVALAEDVEEIKALPIIAKSLEISRA